MNPDQPTPIALPAVHAEVPAPVPPPASPLPPEPVRLGEIRALRSLDRPVPTWRQFTAWPGAASLVTLVSAACLLGGLWGVLEPTLDDPARTADRWSVLATVAGYLACLLPAVWAMCRARAGNPDAVAASVVATALAVGYGLVLHLIAPDAALAGGLAAAFGIVGLAALWRGWTRAAGAVPSAAAAPLAALIVWAVTWPALLGWRTSIAVAPPGGGTDAPVMVCWTIGWALLLAILARLLALAVGGADPWARRDLPFLSRPAMAWVMALVAALGAIVALGVQAHVAGLDLLRSDLLPHLAVLLLAGNELRRRAAGAHAGRDAGAVALLPWLAAVFSLGGRPGAEDLARGLGWAPELLVMATSAPGLALASAMLGGWLAWRHRSGGLAIGAALALTAGILGWDAQRPLVAEALALGGLVVAVGAWTRGRVDIAAAASSCAAACLGGSRLVGELLHLRNQGAGTAIVAGCASVVAWAGCRPAAVSANAAQLAAWCLGLIAGGLALVIASGDLRSDAWQAWTVLGLVAPLVLWCGWRRRDPLIAAAAAPAALVISWPVLRLLIPRQRAWLIVWTAFALLATAVWVAIRRARAGDPCRRQDTGDRGRDG